MKYIDVSKKRKNLQLMKHYDSKNNGYKMFIIDDMEDIEIKKVCKENKLPDYICVNEIKELNKEDFIDRYGENKTKIEFIELKNEINFEYINDIIKSFNIKNNTNIYYISRQWMHERIKYRIDNIWFDNIRSNWKKYTKCDLNRELRVGLNQHTRLINLCYDDNDKLYLSIKFSRDIKQLPKNTNNYIKKNPYFHNGNKVKYSVLKNEYKQKNTIGYNNKKEYSIIDCDILPNKYYWKTPDGWLYLYDKDKPKIFSLNIIQPLEIVNSIESLEIVNSIEPLEIVNSIESNVVNTLVNNILLFTNVCFKKTDKKNLRFGIKEIYAIYEKWCIINGKKMFVKNMLSLKKELELLKYTEEKGQGIDINNKSGKRGYNIIVSL